jgi:outer membrane protein assembly factor BamB
MKRYVEIVTVMVAIMVLSTLMVPSVMSGFGYEKMNDRQTSTINEAMRIASQKCIISMSEGELPPVEELISALEYSGSEQINATQVYHNKNISIRAYKDITGDSITDVLMHVTTTDPITTYSTTDIIAVDGSNGTRLWSKSYDNCSLAVALPVSDLNYDNRDDVIIMTSNLNSGAVIALSGWNGTELWSKYEEIGVGLVMTLGIPANLTSANRTDILVSTNKVDLSTLIQIRITSEITALNGRNGRELWEKTYTDLAAIGYPEDLTNDGKDEVVITCNTLMGMSTLIGVNGADGMELWGERYSDEIDVDFVDDLTGDGANDLTVQIGCCELEGLRGYDGEKLWSIDV